MNRRASTVATARFDDGIPRGLAGAVPADGKAYHSEAAAAVKGAMEKAAIGPEGIDLLELQDNTVYYELSFPEEWGFCKPGEAEHLLESGQTLPSGRLPINPSGGFISFGEATTAQGLFQICELGWQLRGDATGRQVAVQCVERMKKVQLEMGGKNPLVVLDDADLKVAVECAVNGAYFSTGQRCTASSRLIVTAGIHDRFVEAMRERLAGLKVDNALKAGTHVGPVVDQSQLDQDLSYIEIGKAEGARLACGGELLKRETRGFYLSPALFVDTHPQMRINREEIFGPVASVIRVADYQEALAVANDTDFGLASGIVTTSLKHAMDYKRNAQAGMVMVNLPTAGVDYHVPFGGRKGSSYGPREQGRYAAEFYTTVKTAYVLGA